MVGLAIVPATARAQPPSIAVFSSNATKSVAEALAAGFEKASGSRVDFTFASSAELKDRIARGATFDVALLSASTVGDLVAAGTLTSSTRTDIARAGVGVAVKTGASRRDISSPDALKEALLQAPSIAYVEQGATAPILRSIFARFGVTEAVNAKTRLVASAAHAVAAGEAELGFTQISEILNVPGAELLGPLPRDSRFIRHSRRRSAPHRVPQPRPAPSFGSSKPRRPPR